MILLHRFQGNAIWLNEKHIETIESTPDTIITLINDHKYIVKEGPEEICVTIHELEAKNLLKKLLNEPKNEKERKSELS